MINGKKVVATIEGRMTSTRLPGKIMMPLAGRPVMAHMIERHRRSNYTDEVVVATTTNTADDPVAVLAKEMGCHCFRGSENDVLGRIVGAGKKYNADVLVQGMADSPLVDWRLIDKTIELLVSGDYVCASNEFEETFPIGFDVRVYLFKALIKVEQEDRDPAYREHAGYSIRSRPEIFNLVNWKAEGEMLWPTLRLTLDTKEDYTLISSVYDALYHTKPDFSSVDVVRLLKLHPEFIVNGDIQQFIPFVKE